jgi:hypothetical protein
MTLCVNREKHFLEMPLVAWPGAPPPELIGILLAEFATPFADGLIGYDDAPYKEQLFDIPVAEAEAVVQPDAMADDFGGQTMVLVAVVRCWCAHAASMPHPVAAQQVEMPFSALIFLASKAR